MRFNTYVSSVADIQACAAALNVDEVLIEPASLAREGQMSMEQALELAQTARSHGLRPVLVWDALMPQRVLENVTDSLTESVFQQFDAVRISDPGAAFWLLQQQSAPPIQFIVETGNHNLEALRGWEEALSPQLERFILSIELPEEKLIEFCQQLSVECEVLGAGRILLFYSPRSLIAQHLDSDLPTEAESSPSPLHLDAAVRPQKFLNRAFPILETVHGTFMYLDKDQFILDRLDPLRDAGLEMVRIDLRHLSSEGNSATDIQEICAKVISDSSLLRQEWPRPTRAPFFKTNRTTAQFARMKSFLHEERDERCLAEIIGGDNGNYVVYQAIRDFTMDEVESMVLPTGEEVDIPARTVFRDRDGREVRTSQADQILVSGWVKKAASGALLKGRE